MSLPWSAFILTTRPPIAAAQSLPESPGTTLAELPPIWKTIFREWRTTLAPILPYKYGRYHMKIDEKEGASAFYRDRNGEVYHTYSTYERGIDLMNTTCNFLDLTAKGRDEPPPTARRIGCVITTNTKLNQKPAALEEPIHTVVEP
jgi:hypothetical protein